MNGRPSGRSYSQAAPLTGLRFEAQFDNPIGSGGHRRGHADGVVRLGSPETIDAGGRRIDEI